jgi:hypothetical protein
VISLPVPAADPRYLEELRLYTLKALLSSVNFTIEVVRIATRDLKKNPKRMVVHAHDLIPRLLQIREYPEKELQRSCQMQTISCASESLNRGEQTIG